MSRSSITILSVVIVMMMGLSAFLIYRLYGDVPRHSAMEEFMENVSAQEVAEQVIPEREVEGLDRLNGPFEVTNCATGKTDTFQRKDGSLVLADESGNVSWSVPFDGDLCGRACNLDFYSNGKIQFLFASGSRLYLIDRLGHFVDKCCVELGKEVLLGPDVYDFNKNKKYHIVVLNKDNTIDMYDLKGVKPEKWLGIAPKAKILSLPRYSEVEGKSKWTIPTTDGDIVYPFYGGEPLQ